MVGKIVHTLADVQEYRLSFIKVVQLTMAHIFQEQLLNQVQNVIKMQYALHEWL